MCDACGMNAEDNGYWDVHCSNCGACFGGVEVEYCASGEHCEYCCDGDCEYDE